jgi:serine/threonine-protein kinase
LPKPSDSANSLRRPSGVDHQEHIADVLRLRTVITGALLLWGLTAALDWSVVRFVQPGPLSYFLFIRGGAWLVMSVAALRLFVRPPPGPRLLRALELVLFGTASLSASLLCLHYHGIASPYAHSLSCILVVRGVALPYHYRRGIPAALLPASMFPLTLGFASLFLPELRAQFHNPAQLAIFIQNITLILVTASLTVLGGHSMWALRRQVFAARNIGRYRLQHRIGQGGMGEVWQAYHPSLRRAVAIKLLRSHESSPNALSRFEREVRATSELTHPNTIRVFDFGVTDDGLWYYAMELLEGETLTLLVEREGPLPPARALKLIRQACRAIAEAHGRGIVHRGRCLFSLRQQGINRGPPGNDPGIKWLAAQVF